MKRNRGQSPFFAANASAPPKIGKKATVANGARVLSIAKLGSEKIPGSKAGIEWPSMSLGLDEEAQKAHKGGTGGSPSLQG